MKTNHLLLATGLLAALSLGRTYYIPKTTVGIVQNIRTERVSIFEKNKKLDLDKKPNAERDALEYFLFGYDAATDGPKSNGVLCQRVQEDRSQVSLCNAVQITESGYALVNAHCVTENKVIPQNSQFNCLDLYEEEMYATDIYDYDIDHDIALIRMHKDKCLHPYVPAVLARAQFLKERTFVDKIGYYAFDSIDKQNKKTVAIEKIEKQGMITWNVEGEHIVVEMESKPGESGMGVYSNAQLVGLIGGGYNSGIITQKSTFLVGSEVIREFLLSHISKQQ